MNDLSPIIGTICGFGTICFAAVIGVGIIAAVFGFQLFTDYFRKDEDDEAWDRAHEIDKRNPPSRARNFKIQDVRDDFDSQVQKYKQNPDSPTPHPSGLNNFNTGDTSQKSLRNRSSRNRREMGDREDELFGGMLDDEDLI